MSSQPIAEGVMEHLVGNEDDQAEENVEQNVVPIVAGNAEQPPARRMRGRSGEDPWLRYDGRRMRKNKSAKKGIQTYTCDYFCHLDINGVPGEWMLRGRKESEFRGRSREFIKCKGGFRVDIERNLLVHGSEREHDCNP